MDTSAPENMSATYMFQYSNESINNLSAVFHTFIKTQVRGKHTVKSILQDMNFWPVCIVSYSLYSTFYVVGVYWATILLYLCVILYRGQLQSDLLCKVLLVIH